MEDNYTQWGPALLQLEDSEYPAIPDTVRTVLLRHLDSPGRSALSLTCSAGLRWVLQEWPDATMQLAVRADERPALREARVASAQQDLSVRGDQPSALALVQKGQMQPSDGSAAEAMLQPFQPSDTRVRSLSLQLQYLPSALLTTLTRPFTALTTLTLRPAHGGAGALELPPSAALPTLRQLTIGRYDVQTQSTLWRSIRPYVQQLVSLIVDEQPTVLDWEDDGQPVWTLIFDTEHPTNTLTHLSLQIDLEPWLIENLRPAMPALQVLRVKGFADSHASQDHVLLPCSWHTVSFARGTVFPCRAAGWFPVPEQGRFTVDLGPKAQVYIEVPVTPQFAARFAQLDFHDVSSVTIDVRRDTPPATIPTHILNALTLLAPLCSPNTELTLADLDVNATLAAQLPAIAAAAAGWRRLSLTGLVWPETTAGVATVLPPLYKCGLSADLTDALLAQLAQWAPSVTELSVNKATLTVVPERMPCQRLNVLRLAVWELVQQAGVVGEGVEWHLQRLTVYLTPEQVAAREHIHLARQLSQLTNLKRVETVDLLTSMFAMDTPSKDPSLLRAALLVARALPCEAGCITVEGWYATEAVVAELRGLPPWRHVSLELMTENQDTEVTECYWPLARAALLIPRSYQRWDVLVDWNNVRPEECIALILNAPCDRTSEEPLHIHIKLHEDSEETIAGSCESACAKMHASGTYPHVSVTHDPLVVDIA